MRQTTLFDLLEPEPQVWSEIPAAVFLSWPVGMQLEYCARRDDDAASKADTPEEAAWYRERAQGYRDEKRCY